MKSDPYESRTSAFVQRQLKFESASLMQLISRADEYFCYIAGSFASFMLAVEGEFMQPRLTPKDIDVFGVYPGATEELYDYLTMEQDWVKASETKFAWVLTPPETELNWDARIPPYVHLIKPVEKSGRKTWGFVEPQLMTFDLTPCQAALVMTEQGPAGIVHLNWLTSQRNMSMGINWENEDPVVLFRRILRYTQKGYALYPADHLKIFKAWDRLSDEQKERHLKGIKQKNTPISVETLKQKVEGFDDDYLDDEEIF